MIEDVAEIVIIDDDDGLEGDYVFRNAPRDHRTRRATPPRTTGSRAVVRPTRGRIVRTNTRANAGSIVRRDTGGLSTGVLVEAGAQVLAAIQPLPSAPVATGKLESDMENLMLYQKALAEHAKRDEQLRTVGSLASKFFA